MSFSTLRSDLRTAGAVFESSREGDRVLPFASQLALVQLGERGDRGAPLFDEQRTGAPGAQQGDLKLQVRFMDEVAR